MEGNEGIAEKWSISVNAYQVNARMNDKERKKKKNKKNKMTMLASVFKLSRCFFEILSGYLLGF